MPIENVLASMVQLLENRPTSTIEQSKKEVVKIWRLPIITGEVRQFFSSFGSKVLSDLNKEKSQKAIFTEKSGSW